MDAGLCPLCGGAWERGEAAVHGSVWSALFVGFSYQHLWFRDAAGKEAVVVKSGRARDAWRCRQCGFVGIEPGRDRAVRGPLKHL